MVGSAPVMITRFASIRNPDSGCDYCPCLVHCLEHRGEEDETNAAGDARSRSDSKNTYYSSFLHPRYL